MRAPHALHLALTLVALLVQRPLRLTKVARSKARSAAGMPAGGSSLTFRTVSSISASSTNFLIIAFNVFWEVIVYYPPYIRLINPHSKGNSCTNYIGFIVDEIFLNFSSFVCS